MLIIMLNNSQNTKIILFKNYLTLCVRAIKMIMTFSVSVILFLEIYLQEIVQKEKLCPQGFLIQRHPY